MQSILLEAFGLGLVGGVIPGSILTILLISVIEGGYRAGLRAFLWSLAAELTVVGILLLVLFNLPIPETIFNYVGLVGGLVLFYFAWQVYHLHKINQPENQGVTFSGRKIYTLAATNAPLYIFWTTVCAPLIWQMSARWSLATSAASFMIAFEIGWALSTFVVMLLFVKARRYLTNETVMRKVYIAVSIFMFALGVRMLHLSLSNLNLI